MRTQHIIAAGLLSGLLLTSCGREPGAETERLNEQMRENSAEMNRADDAEEWMDEREEARKELADLRESMITRRERESKRLADGIKDAEKRAECEAHIAELNRNIARIDTQLASVESATSETWQDVKRGMRTATDSTKNWFEREAEKIDRKTDADADDDGH